MTELEAYYNKFNEEKRLNSRHGQVEYRISMKYIHIYLDEAAKRLGGLRHRLQKPDPAARHRSRHRALQCGACRGGL